MKTFIFHLKSGATIELTCKANSAAELARELFKPHNHKNNFAIDEYEHTVIAVSEVAAITEKEEEPPKGYAGYLSGVEIR
jgi:N-methylhydantoinase A/oxoprolinase/acetone carboxylase beta subunit